MVLTLSDVLFDTGQATLKPGAALALDRLGKFLQENPETKVIIEGHTDSQGSDEFNMDLSNRRAQTVAQAMTTRGIAADRFQPMGRGEAFPVASNDTAAGRQQNRRVEIIFSDPKGTFAQGASSGAALR
jgi:outer membrane protein OmpA-like peptidoglycan-associated protein